MGFVRIFWKSNVQEAYLPKMSISGQIVSEMLAGYTQKTPVTLKGRDANLNFLKINHPWHHKNEIYDIMGFMRIF